MAAKQFVFHHDVKIPGATVKITLERVHESR